MSLPAHMLMAEFVTLLKDIKDPASLAKSVQEASALSDESQAKLDAARTTIEIADQVKKQAEVIKAEADKKLKDADDRRKDLDSDIAAHLNAAKDLKFRIAIHEANVEKHKQDFDDYNSAMSAFVNTKAKHEAEIHERISEVEARENAVSNKEADVALYETKLKQRAKALRETTEGL